MANPLSTYMMREIEQTRGFRLRSFNKNMFSILNFFLSGLITVALFLIKFCKILTMRKYNVKNYCNDSTYKVSYVPKSDNTFAILFIFFNVGVMILTTFLNKRIEKKSWFVFIKKLLLDVGFLFLHIEFLMLTLELVTLRCGLPAPYFFSNQALESWYCNNLTQTIMPHYLDVIDQSFRETFPSKITALYAFCITFLYLYVDHFDIFPGLHATQQCIVMVFGSYTWYYIFLSVELREYHLEDVVVGYLIGTLQAMIAIRNIFGTVFYTRRHIWFKQDDLPDFFYFMTGDEDDNLPMDDIPMEALISPPHWRNDMGERALMLS